MKSEKRFLFFIFFSKKYYELLVFLINNSYFCFMVCGNKF